MKAHPNEHSATPAPIKGIPVWLSGAAFMLFVGTLHGHASPEPIEFNRDIRPILSKHCTACHGGVKAAGGISFIYRDKALAKGKSGEVAIVPGNPGESELIKRISSTDEDEVMPKPEHGARLSESEIIKLKTWITQGANWSEHWAFVPPKQHPLPQVKDASWGKVPLDAWILAKIESENLAPSPNAPPQEWLRRVSLDLVGIPPTLEEWESFSAEYQNNPRSAKEHVVDRLLSSLRFGERWASMWLDLARYADTFGYEKDPHRDIWPWRDWVIRALNADMPFDQFTIKQLAGDLLPSPTGDDLLATAFHRNTQNNTEGGTDDEEFRVAAALDRVNTTWTAWQATTFGCTQCHSHPYDPFPHKDYYRFLSFFNNTEDNDLNDDFPRVAFPDQPSTRDTAVRLWKERATLRNKINDSGLTLEKRLSQSWTRWTPTEASASGGALAVSDSGKIDASGTLPVGVKYTLSMPAREGITALRLEISPDSQDPKKWPERGSVLSELKLTLVQPDGKKEAVPLREVIADYLAGPFDPQETLNSDKGGFGGYPVLTGPRWCVIVLDAPIKTIEGAKLELLMSQGAVYNGGQGTPIRHFVWSTSTDAQWLEWVQSETHKTELAQLKGLDSELQKLGGVKVPILAERSSGGLRANRMFIRGNRLTPGDDVEPGIPEVSRPPQKQDGLSRLDMAQWLVSEQNTLTARVLANRLWAECFGRGLVETLEDFGTSGASPSHPELLDHLALRLRNEHHWSIKSFLREVALSATYGQSHKTSKQLLESDPRNALFARGPRIRLTAEMVRDQSLAISGLLSSKMFGAPVYPPQPEGVWNSTYSNAKWTTSEGEDRYRRGVYTYVKRTSGYPGYLTFDAPTRDACSARRIPTNTPLQALVTLNDPAFVEMAEHLAKRMLSAGGKIEEQIRFGCRLFTLTTPSKSMVDTLLKLHAKALAENPNDAVKPLLLVANTLLNMDSALSR
ncbi:MAG: PSD1 and planctomycete cytochrome C domain-containing protein [Verrucomicrobiota bacterium]